VLRPQLQRERLFVNEGNLVADLIVLKIVVVYYCGVGLLFERKKEKGLVFC